MSKLSDYFYDNRLLIEANYKDNYHQSFLFNLKNNNFIFQTNATENKLRVGKFELINNKIEFTYYKHTKYTVSYNILNEVVKFNINPERLYDSINLTFEIEKCFPTDFQILNLKC